MSRGGSNACNLDSGAVGRRRARTARRRLVRHTPHGSLHAVSSLTSGAAIDKWRPFFFCGAAKSLHTRIEQLPLLTARHTAISG